MTCVHCIMGFVLCVLHCHASLGDPEGKWSWMIFFHRHLLREGQTFWINAPSSPTHLLSRQVPSWKGNGLHGDRGDCTGAELWSYSCTGWTADSSEDWAVTWRSWEEKDSCLRVFDSVTCKLSFKSLPPDAWAGDEPLDRNVLHLKEHWARRKTRHSLLQSLMHIRGRVCCFWGPSTLLWTILPVWWQFAVLSLNHLWMETFRVGQNHSWMWIWWTLSGAQSCWMSQSCWGCVWDWGHQKPPEHVCSRLHFHQPVCVCLSRLCPHVHPLRQKCKEAFWY